MGNELIAFAGGWEAHRHHHCIWIVSPPGYIYSHAFDEVAEGLSAAFSELGGSAPIVRDPSEWRGRIPIVLGAHLLKLAGDPGLPQGSVIFNLEQVRPEAAWLHGDYVDLLKRHSVLDYSPRNREALRQIGVPHAGLLEIGYSPVLSRIPAAPEKDIDVLFYGWLNERRELALNSIAQAGSPVCICYDMFGAERDAYIARAKLVVNIHHFERAIFEVVRVSFLLANGACVVSEGRADDPDLAWVANGVELCPLEQLPERCASLIEDAPRRHQLAQTGLQKIKARRQSALLMHCIESARSSAGRASTPDST